MEGVYRDEDEMDMTVEQVRCWIQKEVEGNKCLNLKKTQLDQMKMLIDRREEQTASTKVRLNRTRELMSGCETSMKDLYQEIGMVYKETDSEEEIQPMVIEIDDEDDPVDLDEDSDVMCVDHAEEDPQIVNGREGDKKCEGESSLSLRSEQDSDPQEPPCLPSETPGTEKWTGPLSPASTAASSPPRGLSPVSETDSYYDLLSQRLSSAGETQVQIPARKKCCRQYAAQFPVLKNGKEVVVLSKLPALRLLHSITQTRAQREEELQEAELQEEELQKEELQEAEKQEAKKQEAELREEELQEEELQEEEKQEEELQEAELREEELQEEELQEEEKQEEELQEEEEMEEEEKQEAAEESSDGSDADGSDASWKPPKGSHQSSGTESSEESDADLVPGTKTFGRGAAAPPKSRGGPGLTAHKGDKKTTSKKTEEREPSRTPSSTGPLSTTGPPSGAGTTGPPAPAQPQQGNTGKSSVVPPSSKAATRTPPQIPQEAIKVGMAVLARRSSDDWQQSKILEIKSADNDSRDKYKVDLEGKGSWLPGNHIAFDHTPSLGSLYVGVRLLSKGQEADQTGFTSGTLAELPVVKNRMRFLVFLDDGTPCYVGLPRLRLICRPLENFIDEDIKDKMYKDFLEEYLKVYPYTPMAQYRLGQHINTEHNGIQKRCQVEAIDSSLILILFQDDQHKEWLYRGSTRLQHLAQMKKQASKETPENTSALPQQTTTSAGFKPRKYQKVVSSSASSPSSSSATAPPKPAERAPLTSTVIPPRASSTPYTVHRCCPACLGPRGEHRGCNPLFFPLLCGFSRKKARLPVRGYKKKSFHIFYRSPCGVSLSSMSVLEDYLHQTRCDYLSINMFCLDPSVSVTTTFQAKDAQIFIPDLSQGHESQPLSCINELHNHRPRGIFSYIKQQVADGTVSINSSLDFLVGCDCTDGCRDRTSCSCHQLTVEATALEAGVVDVNAGYSHMGLEKRLPTGVYECNSLCRCDPRFCSNRVVQHGLQVRLQVFMTQRKGWGVRCLDDVAAGSFICCYAGKVLTSEEFKNNMLDLFCAKLSIIEGVETHSKDGYESEASCSENETDGSDSEQVRGGEDRVGSDTNSNSNSDVEYRPEPASYLKRSYKTRSNNKRLQQGPEKEAESEDKSDKNNKEEGSSTTRRFFEDEKTSYVISSKSAGNVARFFNHSCSPNLFGQNVFVDNHDLRFPWIAFFAKKRLKAGSELTWDYRSQIGALNESVVKCLCSSPKCRGKI